MSSDRISTRVLKGLLSIYFLFLTISLIALRNSLSKGYELSIFWYTPPLTWVFLIGGNILGLILIIRHVTTDVKSNHWLIGFLILMFNNYVFLTLPNYRGYFLYWGSDPIAQLGWAKDILDTNRIEPTDQYPFTHILMAHIANVGGISLVDLLRYLPAYISVLYMLYIYLLSTSIYGRGRYALLVAATSAPLLFGVFQGSVFPQAIAHLHLPLLLYLYFETYTQTRSVKYGLPLIILIISYPFWHPVTALMVIVGLTLLQIIRANHSPFFATIKRQNFSLKGFVFYPSLIAFILTFLWLSKFTLFSTKVTDVWYALQGTMKEHGQIERLAEQVRLTGWNLVIWNLKFLGHIILYLTLSILGAFLILKKMRKGRREIEKAFTLLLFTITGYMFLAFLFWVLGMITVYRFVRLDNLLFLTPIFAAFALVEISDRLSVDKNKKIILLLLPIISASVISYSSHYYSPWVNLASPQITWFEISGSEWLLNRKELGVYWNGIGYSHIFPYFFVGYHETLIYDDITMSMNKIVFGITRGYLNYPEPPPHLGYDEYETLGRAIREIPHDKGLYLVITQRFLVIKDDPILKEQSMSAMHLARFDINDEDLEQLVKNDFTADRLYSNGGVDIYYVKVVPRPEEPQIEP